MQPELMRLFVDVAEAGSISRVAADRVKAQSYISRQIARLERDCRSKLFERTGRGVVLTDTGRKILPRIRAWLEATEQLDSDIRSSSGVIVGTVRLGVLPSTAHPFATTLYRRVRDTCPGIKLQVIEAGPQLDAWIEGGRLDIAVLFRYGPLKKNETPLATTDTYLVGPAGDALTNSATVEFNRLSGLPLCLPVPQSDLRNKLEEHARRRRVQLCVAVEANSLSFQLGVAREGLCHTLLSPYSLTPELENGSLQAAQIVQPRLLRTLTLVSNPHGPVTPACRAVMRLINEILPARTG